MDRGTKNAHQSLDLSSWIDPPSLSYDTTLLCPRLSLCFSLWKVVFNGLLLMAIYRREKQLVAQLPTGRSATSLSWWRVYLTRVKSSTWCPRLPSVWSLSYQLVAQLPILPWWRSYLTRVEFFACCSRSSSFWSLSYHWSLSYQPLGEEIYFCSSFDHASLKIRIRT